MSILTYMAIAVTGAGLTVSAVILAAYQIGAAIFRRKR